MKRPHAGDGSADTGVDAMRPLLEELVDGLLPARAPPPLDPGTMVGPYEIAGRLGAGGMGAVYRARDSRLERDVALKVLPGGRAPPDSEPPTVPSEGTSLVREAQALARLSHPNVVAVYDVGRFSGGAFVAMELIEGSTLERWLSERPRSWREILGVMLAAG